MNLLRYCPASTVLTALYDFGQLSLTVVNFEVKKKLTTMAKNTP